MAQDFTTMRRDALVEDTAMPASDKARLAQARLLIPSLSVIELLYWSGVCLKAYEFAQFGHDYDAAWQFAQSNDAASNWIQENAADKGLPKATRERVVAVLGDIAPYAPKLALATASVKQQLKQYVGASGNVFGGALYDLVESLEDVVVDPVTDQQLKMKCLKQLQDLAAPRLARNDEAMARLKAARVMALKPVEKPKGKGGKGARA